MAVQITARQTEISSATRGKIEAKAEKLRRFFDRITDIDVILTTEKYRQIAEIVAHCDGFTITAVEEDNHLLTAIDRVFEKAERQIKKHKQRMIDSKRRSPARQASPSKTAPASKNPSAREAGTVKRPFRVEYRQLLALTPEEALDHLTVSKDDLFIFINSTSGRINLLHQQADGHLVLIEPLVE